VSSASGGKPRREFVYVGTYTENSGSKGLYAFAWDSEAETLVPIGSAGQCVNPSYLAFHPSRRVLYAANETPRAARVTVYRLTDSGLPVFLGGVDTPGMGLCHLSVSGDGGLLATACYDSGHVAALALDCDGIPTGELSAVRAEGRGPTPRQEGPHAHQALFGPDRRLTAVDLGLDRIFFYDSAAGRLAPASPPYAALPAGEGPRRLRFHPNGFWVLTELSNRILRYGGSGGAFTPEQAVSVLPEGFAGTAYAADLRLSADTRFLYASVRGDCDGIVRFRAGEDGALSQPEVFPCGGKWPRMFSFSADNRHVFVANQHSGNVAVLRADAETGGLSEPCHIQEVPAAAFVKSVVFT
jgi:6-phosphogluconolactonase (cycloisomerase 2 family)